MHLAMVRNLTLGGDAVLTVEVPDFEALGGESGSSNQLKRLGNHFALARMNQPNALRHILACQTMFVHQLVESGLQGFEF